MEYQNINITNDEEIKEGDYAYHKTFGVGKIININGEDCFVTIKLNPKDGSITTPWKRNIPDIKKIILTTDQDLIKDGVQAIPDEFLEWFVKNPSCEEVEVEIESKFDRVDGHYHDVWEIIIPKEEPKQNNFLKSIEGSSVSKLFKRGSEISKKEKPKQETLEEASYNYAKDKVNRTSHLIGFRKGAKWQQEQCKKDLDAHLDVAEDLWLQVVKQNKNLYSDEEVKHLMTLAFEQGFKKADVVEAGLEAKETNTEVNWIFLKHKK
jgi:hypothetical protein